MLKKKFFLEEEIILLKIWCVISLALLHADQGREKE